MDKDGWRPIETMPEDFEGDAALYGRGHGWRDAPEDIAKEEERIWLLGFQYWKDGAQTIVATETFNDTSAVYVQATLWHPHPLPHKAPAHER